MIMRHLKSLIAFFCCKKKKRSIQSLSYFLFTAEKMKTELMKDFNIIEVLQFIVKFLILKIALPKIK